MVDLLPSGIWVAAERLPEILAVHPHAAIQVGPVPLPPALTLVDARVGDLRAVSRSTDHGRTDDGRCTRVFVRDW